MYLLISTHNGRIACLVFVSVFARIINLMTPGRWLKLSDDSAAMIIAPGDNDALQPLVETENREILDLTMPGSPHVVEVEDRVS